MPYDLWAFLGSPRQRGKGKIENELAFLFGGFSFAMMLPLDDGICNVLFNFERKERIFE